MSALSRRKFISLAGALIGFGVIALGRPGRAAANFSVSRTDSEWKSILSPAEYHVLRQQGTEYPESSELTHEHRPGVYDCVGCDLPLFSSRTKFDSGTGWPSFYDPLPKAIETEIDHGLFMTRTEVHCARCGGHLGHVFDDGPKPTGLRYCMNGIALKFIPDAISHG